MIQTAPSHRPSSAIVVAHPFRAAIRRELLSGLHIGRDADVRAELARFADRLGGTGRLPLPESLDARQAVADAVAVAVRGAAERGDWRAVIALAGLVETFVYEHGLESPLL